MPNPTRFTVPMAEQPWPETEYIGLDNSNPPQWWGWSSDDETAEALQRFAPPHRPGDRIPLREDTWFRESDGLTMYRDGGLLTHETALLSNRFIKGDDSFDATQEPVAEWGWVLVLASEQPERTVRNWGTVVSCVPVRVEGVWCWVVETENG